MKCSNNKNVNQEKKKKKKKKRSVVFILNFAGVSTEERAVRTSFCNVCFLFW